MASKIDKFSKVQRKLAKYKTNIISKSDYSCKYQSMVYIFLNGKPNIFTYGK